MSDSNGLHSRIRSFILEKFPTARKRGLNDDLPLLEAGIVDSLGVLDVIGFLEQTFHIKIDDDELTPDNFASLRCMAAFVEKKAGTELSAKWGSPTN
jgi:acyl carrier protein